MKDRDCMALLAGVGDTLPISDSIQKNLETFTTQVIYNDKMSRNLAEARVKKWNGMKKKKSTQRLPPDTDSHNQHAARGNYISYIYNHYSCREAPPSPLNHGYKLENGKNN